MDKQPPTANRCIGHLLPFDPLHIIGAGASLSVLVHLCVCTCIHAGYTLVKT